MSECFPFQINAKVIREIILITALFFILILQYSCKKFIDVVGPPTSLNSDVVFASDPTATALLTGIYTSISLDDRDGFRGGSGLSLTSLYPGLSSDELTLQSGITNVALTGYYTNSILSTTTTGTDFWNKIYPIIYKVNDAIDGILTSKTLSSAVKKQLLGEAYFMRAFCYFYLVNLYGDVPLILGTDYNINRLAKRTTQSDVYNQIINDLKQSQLLLSDQYLDGTLLKPTEARVRPNKYVATAFLARVYLFNNDNVNAEMLSTEVINNKTSYDTVSLKKVFLKNSKETIWAIQPVGSDVNSNTGEAKLFILPASGPSDEHPVYLNTDLINNFEPGDKRLENWVNSISVGSEKYYYPYKYKAGTNATETLEYITVLRLGELYLIRAEARALQGNLDGATADLNLIRKRSGLHSIEVRDRGSLLSSITHERRVELFTEWGHRWFDLKRTNTVNSVMSVATPKKGGVWNNHWTLYPIPLVEIKFNPNLKQNLGY